MIGIAVGILLYLAGFRLPTEAQLDALDAHLENVVADQDGQMAREEYERLEGLR